MPRESGPSASAGVRPCLFEAQRRLTGDVSKLDTLGASAHPHPLSGHGRPELLAAFEASLHQQIVLLQEQILHLREEMGSPNRTPQQTIED